MLRDIIKKIKYSRLKPEERELYTILNYLEEVLIEKYHDSIFYKIGDNIIFKYDIKNNLFRIDHALWNSLKDPKLIRNIIIKNLNIGCDKIIHGMSIANFLRY